MRLAPAGAVLAALVLAGPAHATFPGGNGRIAYTWSLEGEAFESSGHPGLVGIVSVRPDGRDERVVARGGNEPRYSPGGGRIAFLRSHRLWVAHADGSDARAVTPRGWLVGEHQWSPRGTRLAFARGFNESVRTALYTVKPDGSGLRRLVKAPMPVSLTSGAWSPNARGIVYEQSTGGSVVRVFRAAQITTLARRAGDPTWSRRGLIAYEARVSGESRSEICFERFGDGAPARCVGFTDASLSNPTWSPNGRRLMVIHTPSSQGVGEIWAMRPDGTVLTRGASPGSAVPVFSPNGRLLAFSQTRFAGDPRLQFTDLFVERLDGTGMRRLVRGGQ